MSAELSVRPATAADAPAIAEIHVRTWQVAYRDLMPAPYLAALSVAKREAMWRSRLEVKDHPSRCIWVAALDRRVVGFAVTGDTRDPDAIGQRIGELYALYVAADAWGRGAGRALIERVVVDMTQQGYAAATLGCSKATPAPCAFTKPTAGARTAPANSRKSAAPIYPTCATATSSSPPGAWTS